MKIFNVPVKTYTKNVGEELNGVVLEVWRDGLKMGIIYSIYSKGKLKAKNLREDKILKIKSTDKLFYVGN